MIFYITTHDKNLIMTKLLKNYFSNFDLNYFFVYGEDCKSPISPYIKVACKDSYENLPLKTFFIVEHFLKTKNDYMAKLDDDTFLDIEKLKNFNIKEDYIGVFTTQHDSIENKIYHWFKIQNESFKVPKKIIADTSYAQGACYFLSKKAAQLVYNKGKDFYINTPDTYLGEDVKVGIALNDLDIIKKDIKSSEDLNYEIAEDFLFVHPVHAFVFDKLKNTTNKKKKDLLNSFNILNNNKIREHYISNMIKNLN